MSLPLLAELHRRRVIRALVGYGIAAFAVLQIVEPIMHGLHWPEAVLSYVVVGLAAGFPIVVSLAWIFDVRAGRIERTPSAAAGESARGPRGALLAAILVGIGLLAAAPGLGWYFLWRARDRAPPPAARAPSVAVLPFANLGGDKENEFFSDGITEELIDALANLQDIHVVARTSAFAYKGKNVNVRQIGEELNVATVLEGSVRRQGNQLRVVAQLIGTADGYHLWSKTYDRELKNVFAVEDELAHAIVQALMPRLAPAAALVPQATASAEAHDLYLKGRFFWNQRTKEGLTKAAALFEQAIALDPAYALAHSGLADSYALFHQYGVGRASEFLPKARMHALEAVRLDDSLAEGHTSLANIATGDFDWTTAEREFKRSIQLGPGYATAHQWHAIYLLCAGRFAEAQAEVERARQLDPTSRIIASWVVILLYVNRQYDRAIEEALKALELDPGFVQTRLFLARSYLRTGRLKEAQAALPKETPRDPFLAVRIELFMAAGDEPAARRLLSDLDRGRGAEDVPRVAYASAHLAMGDKDGAFYWLERGVEERDLSVSAMKFNIDLDSLRSDPRYHKLLKRMNLE